MKRWWIVLLVMSFSAKAQIITTIAGSGVGGDGGLATAAKVTDPNELVMDKYGNLFFSENLDNRVRKINAAGIISTVAGTGSAGFSGDNGIATSAQLHQPDGIALDTSGNLFIADGGNNRIRKVNIATGVITTVAGNGNPAFAGDNGLATTASLNHPGCVCFDKYGNMYIGDYGNKRVRKVNTIGIIYTIAGDGTIGWSGDGGPATAAQCNPFNSICMDDTGNLYIAEWSNSVVRKIDTFGIISTIAGDTSSYIYNGDEMPAIAATMDPDYVYINKGDIYISDADNNRIRKIDASGIIHTVVGNGIGGNTGDNGPAITAEIDNPSGIAFDDCNNLYFGQVNVARIRKVTFNPQCAPLSTNQLLINSGIAIYPNPANDVLHIDGISAGSRQAYSILSVIGIAMQQGSLKEGNNSIPIQSLPAGVYVMEITGSEGERIVSKIIKQ